MTFSGPRFHHLPVIDYPDFWKHDLDILSCSNSESVSKRYPFIVKNENLTFLTEPLISKKISIPQWWIQHHLVIDITTYEKKHKLSECDQYFCFYTTILKEQNFCETRISSFFVNVWFLWTPETKIWSRNICKLYILRFHGSPSITIM